MVAPSLGIGLADIFTMSSIGPPSVEVERLGSLPRPASVMP